MVTERRKRKKQNRESKKQLIMKEIYIRVLRFGESLEDVQGGLRKIYNSTLEGHWGERTRILE